jgi:inositol phosphorylceramide mannosyltransferase catalytic subunit
MKKLLIVIYLLSWIVYKASGAEWKDQWLINWEINALKYSPKNQTYDPPTLCNVSTDKCSLTLPRYLPARKKIKSSQVIPRVIWQTWKSYTASGPILYNSIMSFIRDNPDYDYYLFDDEAALEFMCKFFPQDAQFYQKIVPGAVRADIWRAAVVYKYGGVYFDVDSVSTTPLSHFIWPNSSLVTGLGSLLDFHQWALLYRPRHIIMKRALKVAVTRLKHLYQNKRGGDIVSTTGPGALAAAVHETLGAKSCQVPDDFRSIYAAGAPMIFLKDSFCDEEVGVLQIYPDDFLGGNVIFKADDVDNEKDSVSLYYGHV